MKKIVFVLALLALASFSFGQSVGVGYTLGSTLGVSNQMYDIEVYPFGSDFSVSSSVFIEEEDLEEDYDYRAGINLYPGNLYANLSYGRVIAFGSETHDLSAYFGYGWYLDNIDINFDGSFVFYSYDGSQDLGTWDVERAFLSSGVTVTYYW